MSANALVLVPAPAPAPAPAPTATLDGFTTAAPAPAPTAAPNTLDKADDSKGPSVFVPSYTAPVAVLKVVKAIKKGGTLRKPLSNGRASRRPLPTGNKPAKAGSNPVAVAKEAPEESTPEMKDAFYSNVEVAKRAYLAALAQEEVDKFGSKFAALTMNKLRAELEESRRVTAKLEEFYRCAEEARRARKAASFAVAHNKALSARKAREEAAAAKAAADASTIPVVPETPEDSELPNPSTPGSDPLPDDMDVIAEENPVKEVDDDEARLDEPTTKEDRHALMAALFKAGKEAPA